MMRFWLIVIAFAFLASPQVAQGENLAGLVERQPFWLQQRIKWEKAPKDIDTALSAGAAVTLYFGPGGDFRMLSGTVYKRNGSISASEGDSESIWKGKWVLDGEQIQVQFQLIYHDIRIQGEHLPGSIERVTFRFEPKKRLLKANGSTGIKLDGREFGINPMLVLSSVEQQIRFGGSIGKSPN